MKWFSNCASQTVCRSTAVAYDLTASTFPRLVRIETTNACNAKCVICPHRDIKRPIQRMEDALFDRILAECREEGCSEIHLHNFGEPLMDPSLPRRAALCKEAGIPKVKIFTNGALLDAARAEALLDSGIDEIKISFDGASREEFEKIRFPLKFDTVVENVSRLVTLRNKRNSPLRIEVACCSTTDQAETMKMLAEVVDGFSFGKIHNWGDGPQSNGKTIRKPCSRLWRTMTILASGEVALCCLDYDGRTVLGNIGESQSIKEVWNGEAYDQVRHLHRQARQEEIPLCSNCTKSFL